MLHYIIFAVVFSDQHKVTVLYQQQQQQNLLTSENKH